MSNSITVYQVSFVSLLFFLIKKVTKKIKANANAPLLCRAHAQELLLIVSCFTGFAVMVEDSAACFATYRKALCPALLSL